MTRSSKGLHGRMRPGATAGSVLTVLLALHGGFPSPAVSRQVAHPAQALAEPIGERPAERSSEPMVEAEALFRSEPRWLGGDAAYSVPLAPGRTLWLFGDSFVALKKGAPRRGSRMVSNTLAVQTGDDLRRSSMRFHWGRGAGGAPAAFFADQADGTRLWPGHGIRLEEGPLVLFLHRVRSTPGEGLGFAHVGYAVVFVDDPDAPVEAWTPRLVPGPPFAVELTPGAAVLRDGAHVVALAVRQGVQHTGALLRFRVSDLRAGRLGVPEWWGGDAVGWVPEAQLPAEEPAWIMDEAGAECSLHWDAVSGRYLHVASYGFGASTIGLRTAPSLTGPWSAPETVYLPPESKGERPFVYAAKAHPELRGPRGRDLILTYATNSFDFAELVSDEGLARLYWPRVVRLRLGAEGD